MIGSGVIEGNPQELFEGRSIVDLRFQLRVGINVKPLLQEQAFHKKDRWIRFVASGAIADGVGSCEQVFNSGPVHDGIDLFHSFDRPVLFDGSKEGNVRKGEVGLHFFKAHKSSRGMNLEDLWHIIR